MFCFSPDYVDAFLIQREIDSRMLRFQQLLVSNEQIGPNKYSKPTNEAS
jgi:hypothetical protein